MSAEPWEDMRGGDVEDGFYEILAGGARYALFTTLVDLELPALLAGRWMTTEEICAALGLDPLRGRKWLHLLHLGGFVDRYDYEDGSLSRFTVSKLVRAMFGRDGRGGWFNREFLRYYRVSMSHNAIDTLRGTSVSHPVRYPPQADSDIVLLHEWMRSTALSTLATIERHVDFSKVRRLLDVGGGDGTMALELWGRHPGLSITVYNLPAPVAMARSRIAALSAQDRVTAVEGDFRRDALPRGFDMVLFSRVLADWPPEFCRSLIGKAREALDPGGRLVICEPLSDQNPALAVAWEQSYLPYDDFGVRLYKPLHLYEEMLAEAGLRVASVHPRDDTTIHCVIIAEAAA